MLNSNWQYKVATLSVKMRNTSTPIATSSSYPEETTDFNRTSSSHLSGNQSTYTFWVRGTIDLMYELLKALVHQIITNFAGRSCMPKKTMIHSL